MREEVHDDAGRVEAQGLLDGLADHAAEEDGGSLVP
jgi:hypothetical protein